MNSSSYPLSVGMVDGRDYDALNQTPTAALSCDLEKIGKDEELMTKSLSPYFASTQSPNEAALSGSTDLWRRIEKRPEELF